MKNFYSFLILILVSIPSVAQDIISKKDGTTIQAKVLKVTESIVEYKKFSSQEGPTYTISIENINNITYPDGTKDVFSNSTSVQERPSSLGSNSLSQYNSEESSKLTDAELMRMSSKGNGKGLKIAGLVLSGVCVATGVCAILSGETPAFAVASVVSFAVGVPLLCVGLHRQKQYKLYNTASIFEYEIPFGKEMVLAADFDIIRNNMNNRIAPGVGLRINF